MSRLHSSLSDIVRNEEEIKLSINDFRLFNKALVNIGTWWWIENVLLGFLEESLSYSLVDNDKSNLWPLSAFLC